MVTLFWIALLVNLLALSVDIYLALTGSNVGLALLPVNIIALSVLLATKFS